MSVDDAPLPVLPAAHVRGTQGVRGLDPLHLRGGVLGPHHVGEVRADPRRDHLEPVGRAVPEPGHQDAGAVPFPELAPRETTVLDLLAAGLNNAAIAARLQVAPKTVANNVSAILVKLQVADRAQAIVRARDAGLGRQ